MKKNRKAQQKYLTKKGYKRFEKSLRRKNCGICPTNSNQHHNVDYNDILKHIYNTTQKENEFFPNIRSNYDLKKKILYIPKNFSLVENPKESFSFITKMTNILFKESTTRIIFDYSQCKQIDLDAQVYMDIILMYIIDYFKQCRIHGKRSKMKSIEVRNIENKEVQKVLFSVGSAAIVKNIKTDFPDIIPYRLCIGRRDPSNIGQKEIDITNLVDYVILSLRRVNKELGGKKIADLCQIIGEILANAEEHSSLNSRFSIGYYKDINDNGQHQGILNLVILNFGDTIYEKFKDPLCPRKSIVSQMKKLSQLYTKRNFFFKNRFEEETLWTLYALQEGVTSKSQRRGNGSIRFIESFFNLSQKDLDNKKVSNLSIFSGNTEIKFDGTYKIEEKLNNNSNFKVMTFNDTGDIKDKPDKQFVQFSDYYFPGTMISIKILLTEEDLINNE